MAVVLDFDATLIGKDSGTSATIASQTFTQDTTAQAEIIVGRQQVAVTGAPGGTDLITAGAPVMTQINMLIIQNLSAVDTVEVTWDDSAANSNTQNMPVSSVMVIPDVDPATAVWAAGAAGTVILEVAYVGV
jgi:hypothetical protein